jgi:hypothetical protein
MTTQTTMPLEQADRPTEFTIDHKLSGPARAVVWAGLVLVSLAMWTGLIVGTVLLFNGA